MAQTQRTPVTNGSITILATAQAPADNGGIDKRQYAGVYVWLPLAWRGTSIGWQSSQDGESNWLDHWEDGAIYAETVQPGVGVAMPAKLFAAPYVRPKSSTAQSENVTVPYALLS